MSKISWGNSGFTPTTRLDCGGGTGFSISVPLYSNCRVRPTNRYHQRSSPRAIYEAASIVCIEDSNSTNQRIRELEHGFRKPGNEPQDRLWNVEKGSVLDESLSLTSLERRDEGESVSSNLARAWGREAFVDLTCYRRLGPQTRNLASPKQADFCGVRVAGREFRQK